MRLTVGVPAEQEVGGARKRYESRLGTEEIILTLIRIHGERMVPCGREGG
jgi:hypothetical protein